MALPLVLAGPIVRRVEPTGVAVWLALREHAAAELRIWPGIRNAHPDVPGAVDGDDEPLHTALVTTTSIGSGFHVAPLRLNLGQAPPDAEPLPPDTTDVGPALDPGQIYSYDVTITPDGGATTGLLEQGLLSDGPLPDPAVSADAPDNVPLGYAAGRLPSFATCPPKLEDLILMHGSCRKVTKSGDDAMVYLDRLIERDIGNPLGRPHQLFLTGDQIYADGVSGALLQVLIEVGRELIGGFERLPIRPGLDVPASSDLVPPLSRERLCVKTAQFSTMAAENHLLSLGEFFAMYLLAWSPSCWRTLSLDEEAPAIEGTNPLIAPGVDLLDDWRKRIAEAATEEEAARVRARVKRLIGRTVTEEYRDLVPRARRVLANVATYMVFDDHEVTDHWNQSLVWRSRVFSSDLGSTIIRNALVAAAACEGWGNDPAAWLAGKNQELLAAAHQLFSDAPAADGSIAPVARHRDAISKLFGHDGSNAKIKWRYQVDAPAHRVVALDTRTHRDFPTRYAAPELTDAANLGIPKGPLRPPQELLVLVSAPPVVSLPVFSVIGQPAGAALIDAFTAFSEGEKRVSSEDTFTGRITDDPFVGAPELELEGWIHNDDAFERLLAALASYPRVVILSGDVHSSASLTIDYWRKAAETPSRFVQLICSGVRQRLPSLAQQISRQLVPAQNAIIGQASPIERLGWKANIPPPLAGTEDAFMTQRARLRREPVLVPTTGWPDTVVEVREPDFAWRIAFIDDVRRDVDRPAQVRPPPLGELQPEDPLPGYRAVLSAHLQALETSAQVRRVVWDHAAARVRFLRNDDGSLEVHHEIFTRNARNASATTPDLNTLHVAPLDAAPADQDRPRIQV